jgi:uncharacterized membrane protein YhaH (DUF805 family)
MTTTIPTPAPQQPGSAQDIWQICWSIITTRYAQFAGTAGRREYWTFWVARSLIYCGGLLFIFIPVLGVLIGALVGLFWLATFIPRLAAGSRRLHDMGHTGWWQLLLIIPIFGAIALIIMCAQPTRASESTSTGEPPQLYMPSTGPMTGSAGSAR